jgi:predicted enzyme related to lactoylglutathione lyase
MPIGNPMGDDTQFDERGNLESLDMVMVPVRDLSRSLEFYIEVLGLTLVSRNDTAGLAELAAGEKGCRIMLAQKRSAGVDTGLVFTTRSVFDLHRKFVDREVEFVLKPTRINGLGVLVEFLDVDGNHLRALENEG